MLFRICLIFEKYILGLIIIILGYYGCNNGDKREDYGRKPLPKQLQDRAKVAASKLTIKEGNLIDHYKITTNIETINVNIEQENSLKSSELLEYFKYVHLETTQESIIGTVEKLMIHEDRIFILDSRNSKGLFVFDTTGVFLHRIGNIGKGPGEYIGCEDFQLDKENLHILIFDANSSKIIRYNWEGDFISETEFLFYFRSFNLLDNQYYVIDLNQGDGNAYVSEKLLYELMICSKNGHIVSRHFPMEGTEHLRRYNTFDYGKDSLNVVIQYKDTIFRLTPEKIYPKYSIDFGDNKLPHNFFNKLKTYEEKKAKSQDLYKFSDKYPYVQGIYNVIETDDHLLLGFRLQKYGRAVLYNKANKQVYNHIKDDLGIGLMPSSIMTSTPRQEFVSVMDRILLKAFLEMLKGTFSEIEWKQKFPNGQAPIEEVLSKLKDADNPVLLFLRPKSISTLN